MKIEHSALALSTPKGDIPNTVISKNDGKILRTLGARVSEIAAMPIQSVKRKLWYDHNELKATRPLIFCDPELGWGEIIPESYLQCEGDIARRWEMFLLKEIFWAEKMGDDKVIEPYFNISYVYDESDWGMHVTKVGGEDGGSYSWDAPLKNYEDFHKLHFPVITVNYQKTNEIIEQAQEIFNGLLNVRIKGIWWWSLGLTYILIHLRGLNQIMYDMYDKPNELCKLMALLRDGQLARLDYLENNNLLGLNNDGTYVGSGGFGYTNELPQRDFDNFKVRTKDMWGFSESQETSIISSEMYKEFVFPYEKPILDRFGLNCYGCCEPLNNRWKYVKQLPNLRRISVSPWADIKDMAEKIQDKYIFSLKQSPTDLVVTELDEYETRKKIKHHLNITKDCRVELLMKDNSTICNNPENVIAWCRIAKEEAESLGN